MGTLILVRWTVYLLVVVVSIHTLKTDKSVSTKGDEFREGFHSLLSKIRLPIGNIDYLTDAANSGVFICPGPGIFPIKGSNCRQYHRCLNKGDHPLGRAKCPAHFLFHPVHRKCKERDVVDCYVCAVDGDKFDPDSEDNFIRCVDGIAYRLQCYPGQVFDAKLHYCRSRSGLIANLSDPSSAAINTEPSYMIPIPRRNSEASASALQDGRTNAVASADAGDGIKSAVFSEGLHASESAGLVGNASAKSISTSDGVVANSYANSTGAFVGSASDGSQNSSAKARSQNAKSIAVSTSDNDGSKAQVISGIKNNRSTESPLGQSRAAASILTGGQSASEAEVATKIGMNASSVTSGNGTSQAVAGFNETHAQAMSAAEGVVAMSGANLNGSKAVSRADGTSNSAVTAMASNNETEVMAASNKNESQARGSLISNETLSDSPPRGNSTEAEKGPGPNDFKTNDIAPEPVGGSGNRTKSDNPGNGNKINEPQAGKTKSGKSAGGENKKPN